MSSTVNAIALSGIAAASTRLNVSAHNIANAHTPGFHRQEVVQRSAPEGGVAVSVRPSPAQGAQLSQDIITQLSASYTYRANLQTVETSQEMLGSLLDTSA